MRHHLIMAGIGLWLLAPRAAADLVSVVAVKDNTLYESPDGSLSNGSGSYLFTGTTVGGAIRRGLVAFDVASQIPAGSTIDQVTLRLYMSKTNAASEFVDVHRVLADWGEGASDALAEEGGGAPPEPGDATWIHTFYDTAFWSTPGGEFDPAFSGSQLILGNGFYSWTDPGLVADVQTWLDLPTSNFGWLLHGNEAFPTTSKRFDSRENADPSHWPTLEIEYTPVPEPASGLLAVVTCLAFCRRERFRDLKRQ